MVIKCKDFPEYEDMSPENLIIELEKVNNIIHTYPSYRTINIVIYDIPRKLKTRKSTLVTLLRARG